MRMHHSILGLSLIAIAGGCVAWFSNFASAPATPLVAANPRHASIVFDTVVWQNGLSSPIMMTIPVTNLSAEMVRFGELTCDCGCTTSQLAATQLNPGESTTMTMSVNEYGRHGPMRFTYHWPDNTGAMWTAIAQTTIYQPARFEPSVVHFGHQHKPGDSVTHQVWLEEYAEQAVELATTPVLATLGQGFSAVAGEAVVVPLEGGCFQRRTPVTITQIIPHETGHGSSTVRLESRRGNSEYGAAVTANWTVRDAVTVSPRQVAVQFACDSLEAVDRVVMVSGPSGGPVSVRGLTVSDGAITAGFEPGDTPNQFQVKISVRLAPEQRLLAGWMTIKLSLPEPAEVRIPVTAIRAKSIAK